ncbi:MAG: peptidase C69 [Gammaproteobacteria bacterium]|nr:peptidase C69 [Gammaproteobacteria bacterium]
MLQFNIIMKEDFINQVKQLTPNVDYCSFRFVNQFINTISVTRNIVEPVTVSEDDGVMVSIINNGGIGYGSSSDLTTNGLKLAIKEAIDWSEFTKHKIAFLPDYKTIRKVEGNYYTKEETNWTQVPTKDKIDYLTNINKILKSKPSISNWGASLRYKKIETLFIDTNGSCFRQRISFLLPQIVVSATYKKEIQTRTYGGHAHARQIGYDFLDRINLNKKAAELSEESIQLSKSPNCPDQKMSALIAPDQMILQLHESIGHPLELDRILGDERNYAGSSFVTLDMFGKYQYGSECLNVTFNPTLESQLATYNFDDDGTEASKQHLIKNGMLVRPIGGQISGQRTGLDHVACSRASNWNRPPIDRMGNINIEPGEHSDADMISSVENGILLETNNSWSIDDKRNKFQFSCEKGTLIRNGELKNIVKNPSYRGVTKNFWHNLEKVGNQDSQKILGTSNCGKGEPNQTMFVGHSTPMCLFDQIEVFGGL